MRMFSHFFRSKTQIRLDSATWPAALKALRERLATTSPTDPLWRGVLELIEANIRTELEPLTAPGLDPDSISRQRGRVSMLVDLKAELERLYAEVQADRLNKDKK